MGGAASVESIWASERVRNEYERYCRQVAEGTEEARELSMRNYGRDEWWLLLRPVEGASS